MPGNLSSDYQEIPPGCTAYDYDNPSPPFTPEEIAAIDSIKDFLSDSELAQARRLETVYYSPIFKNGGGERPFPDCAPMTTCSVCTFDASTRDTTRPFSMIF